MEAALVQQLDDEQDTRPYLDRRRIDDIKADAASAIRARFLESDDIPLNAHLQLDLSRSIGAEASRRMLVVLGQAPTEDVSVAAFRRTSTTLSGWWDEYVNRRGDRDRSDRDYEMEFALKDLLQVFLLRARATDAASVLEPILESVDRHPHEVYGILKGLIVVEDRQPNTVQFWSLWELFADKVREASWLPHIDDEHASGTEMVSAIFLGVSWNEGIRHWRSLEGQSAGILRLFEDLPPSRTVLNDFLQFLYHVGEQSLPAAFILIAGQLQVGDARRMLSDPNSVFLLELLLQRFVYGRPIELKSQPNLRAAALVLLDLLVENGSPAAFRMRDDFVTPVSLQ